MIKSTYRRLVLGFFLTVILIGVSDAQPQASLSVEIHPDATPTLAARVSAHEGYAVASETHQPTGTAIHFKPVRPGHTGEGKLNYQVTPKAGGGKVAWNSRSKEAFQGAGSVQALPFQPPLMPPMPPLPPLPPMPPMPAPPMGFTFPIPPMPGQPPVIPGFPQGTMAPPQGAWMPPVMPPAFPQMVPPMPGQPMIPESAQTVSESTGEGMVDYQKSANGSGHSLSWSSSSSTSTRSTWPPSATGVTGKGKTKTR